MLSVTCIILSILAYCLDTVPSFLTPIIQTKKLNISNQNIVKNSWTSSPSPSPFQSSPSSSSSSLSIIQLLPPFLNKSNQLWQKHDYSINNQSTNQNLYFIKHDQPIKSFIFIYIECICNFWFTIELLVRFVVALDYRKFVKNLINLIDIAALLSFYTEIIFYSKFKESHPIISPIVEFCSIVRVMRLFKLTRYISGLKILILTFRASAKEFSLLVFFLGVFIVLFAALIYYAERLSTNPRNDFTSIPIGLWWAIVTMTTVGYGDMTPRSYAGKLL